jgi:hypothetical protein
MDVSDLRKRIIHALDDARKEASDRRRTIDESRAAFETFLERVAGPLFKQAATVLRGEGHDFTLHTPAGSVRLAGERSPDQYLELELRVENGQAVVVGRTSVQRGSREAVVDEVPLAPGKSISDLTENDVTHFLVKEIPRLVARN